jgi:hypothetical protein
MTTMSTKKIDAEIEQLQRQLEAAKKAKADEEKAEKARIGRARKHAGDNHTRAVLELYDRLSIDPEVSVSRVTRDRDETVRTHRLLDMLDAIIDAADPALLDSLRRADAQGVAERTPTPRPKPSSAPAADESDHHDEVDSDDDSAPEHAPSPTPYASAA